MPTMVACMEQALTSQRFTAVRADDADLDTGLLEAALFDPAREFLSRPSKGLRAGLIHVCHAIAGGSGSLPSAAVDMIELLHSGSLIVDDIQDGADVRRGGPALHHVIGMPRALNTGNWLYFVALTRLDELALDDARARGLGRATHRCLIDCHEGQSLDLALKVADIDPAELPAVVSLVTQLKTGAPMGLAARLGATLAGASARSIEALVAFGKNAGSALQMLDDLGSLVSEARHHKGLEDLGNQRVSWVWSWAAELLDRHTFQDLVAQLSHESDLTALKTRLAEITEPVGRARAHHLLYSSESELRSNFPPSWALDVLHAELERLEHSFG
jgi:geranylgeranyl pyrophosphate synthase